MCQLIALLAAGADPNQKFDMSQGNIFIEAQVSGPPCLDVCMSTHVRAPAESIFYAVYTANLFHPIYRFSNPKLLYYEYSPKCMRVLLDYKADPNPKTISQVRGCCCFFCPVSWSPFWVSASIPKWLFTATGGLLVSDENPQLHDSAEDYFRLAFEHELDPNPRLV